MQAYWDIRRRVECKIPTCMRIIMAQHAVLMIDFIVKNTKRDVALVGVKLAENQQLRESFMTEGGILTELDERYEEVVKQMVEQFDNIAMAVADQTQPPTSFGNSDCARFYEMIRNGRARIAVRDACKHFDHYLYSLSLLKQQDQESFFVRAYSCIMSAIALGTWLDAN